jgi:hypothetical protein
MQADQDSIARKVRNQNKYYLTEAVEVNELIPI